jgi:ubiquinone/menaquinone biosynthesis C-methylase UbiE
MKRSELFGDVQYFYENFYSRTVGQQASGIRSVLWKYPHRIVEQRMISNGEKDILEIGAGNGEHIPFVKPHYNSYHAVDIRPSKELQSLANDKVVVAKADVENLEFFRDDSFDRVIAMCLLAHLRDPEKALSEVERVVKPGGLVQIYLPCEPGLLLRLFRKLVTSPAVSRMGYQGFDLFMAREHRNSITNLLALIEYRFSKSQIEKKRRPFPFFGWNLNLFYLIEIRVEK